MTRDSAPIVVDGIEAYPSLAALREAHGALVDQRRTGGDAPELLAAAERFIQQGVVTGAVLDGSEDRRAAQSLLNCWANTLYRADRAPLDATLAEFDPLLAPPLPDALCPYVGLDAFTEASATRFFGRQELIGRLLDRLREQRLVALVGPSGSGKSSVVRAGLLPALRRGALPGSESWRCLPPIVPGSDPLANLDRALRAENQEPRADDSQVVLSTADLGSALVLVVDQFEEVFTLCDDAANRQAFIGKLLALASAPEPVHRVILTMRSDFETFVARVPELQPVFERGRVQVTPLSAAELRQAIEAPAAQVGLKFEQGVVDLLLHDILGEPAGLPLLQFTLLKLWEKRERNRVTRAAYEQVGGGRRALARSADEFYQSLIPEEQVTARRMLLRMARPGEGLEITSSRVRRTALAQGGEDPERIQRVLDRLIAARLVRLSAGDQPDDDQVEIAHEALVRNWPTLVEWLEQEKTAIAMRRRLESRADEWARLGSGTAGLLDEVEWREAERWLQGAEALTLGYDPWLWSFVTASRVETERKAREQAAARQRELEQAQALAEAQRKLAEAQARTARRLRWAALLLVVLLLIALVTAIYAFQQRETTDVQRLAFAARTQFDAAPETGLLLAYEAARREAKPFTEQTLREALDRHPPVEALQGHTADLTNAVFSPDGQRILTSSGDNTARVWDLSGRQLAILSGHTDDVFSATFSPDGQRIVTASADKTAQVWDLSGKPLATLRGHTDRVYSAVFSPDGQRILTASRDKTARLWDLSGNELATLQGHADIVYGAVFSPDGKHILTASRDKTARLWDLAGKQLATLEGHGDLVQSAVFSPDGQRIVTASYDKTARLWDLSGNELATLQGHADIVYSAVFSPDGERILTASADQTARVWDLNGKELATLEGHGADVRRAVFSPDGQRILTASYDKTARLWDLAGKPLDALHGHVDIVISAVFSPDGQHILTASHDRTARLWDLAGKELTTFQGHTDWVRSAVFSPDGKRILTASDDKTARVWDLAGKQLAILQGHTSTVISAVFSPDGQHILTSSYDKTARVWDLNGNPLMTIEGHEDAVFSAVYSPDGQRILTASRDQTARVWDLSGKELATLRGHTAAVRSAVFSPDGQRILTASYDNTARVWYLSGKLLVGLQGHTGWVRSAVFSPDGQRILTASADQTARVWDLSGNELATLQTHLGVVYSAVFSPDGQRILTASADHTARYYLYLEHVEDLLAVAACRVARGLTQEEIDRFNVGTPSFDFAKRQCPPAVGGAQ